ncbi:MAG: Cna B-type domain-containing protein [Actinomycetaceae bacterium]|nr:Cna B-type domain-containing protein [Actinomycetaceae bacterium]
MNTTMKGKAVSISAVLILLLTALQILPPAAQATAPSDENYILVEKTFVGLPTDKIPANFQVTLTSDSQTYYLTSASHGWTEVVNGPENVTWTWSVNNAVPGTYTVTEQNADVENYGLTPTSVPAITVVPTSFSLEGGRITPCNRLDWAIDLSPNSSTLLVLNMTQNKGNVVITADALSASEREAAKQSILNYPEGPFKNADTFYFFSIEENGNQFNVEHVQINYYGSGYEGGTGSYIHIGDQSYWTQMLFTDYSVTSPINPAVTLTNQYAKQTIEVLVDKVWEDANDQDGVRPDMITVELLANGQPTGNTLDIYASDDWQGAFTGLDEFAGGEPINYCAVEKLVDGYETVDVTCTTDGITVVNSRAVDTIDIVVKKVWDDANDKDGLRPKSVTVKLLANGKPTDYELILSEDNNWKASFTDLDKNMQGEKITYTIEEVSTSDAYVSVISGDQDSGFTITNTHEPKPADPASPPPLAKTGVAIGGTVALVVLLLGVGLAAVYGSRQYKREQ